MFVLAMRIERLNHFPTGRNYPNLATTFYRTECSLDRLIEHIIANYSVIRRGRQFHTLNRSVISTRDRTISPSHIVAVRLLNSRGLNSRTVHA